MSVCLYFENSKYFPAVQNKLDISASGKNDRTLALHHHINNACRPRNYLYRSGLGLFFLLYTRSKRIILQSTKQQQLSIGDTTNHLFGLSSTRLNLRLTSQSYQTYQTILSAQLTKLIKLFDMLFPLKSYAKKSVTLYVEIFFLSEVISI